MRGKGGGKCSGVTTMTFSMVVMSLLGEKKGACMNVSTPTLESLMEPRKSV